MRKKDLSIQVVGIAKGEVEAEATRLTTQPDDGETIVATGTGNMPEWAGKDGQALWHAADLSERKTGAAALGITLAMPDGISVVQSQALVKQFAKEELGPKAYAFAIFAEPVCGEPSVARLLCSARVQDGIFRDSEHFFRRYRKTLPAFSGARKDGAGKVRGAPADLDLTRRQNWRRMSAEAIAPTPKAIKNK